MNSKFLAVCSICIFVAGCVGGARAVMAYKGNGDADLLAFMSANYMSSEAVVAEQLGQHLEEGLPPGQMIDKSYLLKRGAFCVDGAPVVCKFHGVVDEHFSGVPSENSDHAHRLTKIAARFVLLEMAKVEVTKVESYPEVKKN